jgi:solute carrier family 6 GABA transporter-like protein 6/8/11/12/13
MSMLQAYKNGGGSFVLPCFIMLVLVGIPLVFMELALGQFSACGPTKLFGRMAPIFGGFYIFTVHFKMMLRIKHRHIS